MCWDVGCATLICCTLSYFDALFCWLRCSLSDWELPWRMPKAKALDVRALGLFFPCSSPVCSAPLLGGWWQWPWSLFAGSEPFRATNICAAKSAAPGFRKEDLQEVIEDSPLQDCRNTRQYVSTMSPPCQVCEQSGNCSLLFPIERRSLQFFRFPRRLVRSQEALLKSVIHSACTCLHSCQLH